MSASLPHHAQIPGVDGLSCWRWVCLRGAGFPADLVEQLAAPQACGAIEALFAAERELEARKAEAISRCQPLLTSAPDPLRKRIKNTLRRLSSGLLPLERPEPGPFADALAPLWPAQEAVEQRAAEAEKIFQGDSQIISTRLHEVASRSDFREAVAWQNAAVLKSGIASFLRHKPGGADGKTRRNEGIVASYLQRYCTKNDTIGFFGPVGWGKVDSEGPPLRVAPGQGLLATRTVYFEHWAIDALAEKLSEDPALLPWLAPRRMPTVRVEGNAVRLPGDRRVEVSPAHARALELADGNRPAREIVAALCEDSSLELGDEDEAYAVLEALCEASLAVWALEVPTLLPHPDRAVREILLAVGDEPVRARALGQLERLVHCRDQVARAAGDSDRLATAIDTLESTFTELTGKPAQRSGGQTYASRTLVYEDCLRDLDFSVGPALLSEIGKAVEPLLQSARWYTFQVAKAYLRVFDQIYDRLAAGGRRELDFSLYFGEVNPYFATNHRIPSELVLPIHREFQARWAQVLGLSGGAPVFPDPQEVAARAAKAFAAPCAGWPRARCHAPDLMLRATDPEAVARGNYEIVFGELHVGINTLLAPPFLNQHPRREELIDAFARDLPDPRIAPTSPKSIGGQRAQISSFSPQDLHLEVGVTRSWRPRSHVLSAADAVVVREGGELKVKSIDGRWSFHVLAFFEQFLTYSKGLFEILPETDHTPRVKVGRLIASRESWRFDPSTLPFVAPETPYERFRELRRWAAAHRLPRFLFFKMPEETKPTYLDLESPVLIENFIRMVKKASGLQLSEMSPGLDGLWLRDALGNRYTSELRFAFVDPAPWNPGAIRESAAREGYDD